MSNCRDAIYCVFVQQIAENEIKNIVKYKLTKNAGRIKNQGI